MRKFDTLGSEWAGEQVAGISAHIEHISPSEFNEMHRYLPESVTGQPGLINFSVNPFMIEILDCFDVDSPVRDVTLQKGVQITWTTILEAILLYFMAHIKTLPIMFVSADKELVDLRVENNILPMLQQSGFADIIQSSDEGNSRKTGKNQKQIQFVGGGYMIPFGAQNANKLRATSIAVMLKDEVDAWPLIVGKDGDPDALTDARLKGTYYDRRKIARGGTPLIEGTSKVEKSFKRGDQRYYMVFCLDCGHEQRLRWSTTDDETGIVGGITWELDDGVLIPDSVRYCCCKCGHPHTEDDKERLFSRESGAYWKPTARPVAEGVRSYHLSSLYSPYGFQPWKACVEDWLNCWDVDAGKVKDIGLYQVFCNNILGETFAVLGSKILFTQVSAHRRVVYRFGEIPNGHAAKFAGSEILFLTCQVDVHKNNLAVAVMGWTRDARCYTVEYMRIKPTEDSDDCSEVDSSVWGELRNIIEEKRWTVPDGKTYGVAFTVIDSGYAADTVKSFCSVYSFGVYPIKGRDRPAKAQKIREFDEFETQDGIKGYAITVDHYKDRIAPVLRREWFEEMGDQGTYHFNAPVDITDAQLKELTKETRVEEIDPHGAVTYRWKRAGNAKNELWDLLVYGHAAVEILAWLVCIEHFELDTIDWAQFWEFCEGAACDGLLNRTR